MKKSIVVLGLASLLNVAAHAEDPPAAPAASAAAEAPADPLSFNIGVISDYRYRGISQTRFKPAVQGGADYAFASGLYVGTWISNINWIKDAGKVAGADVGSAPIEWDLYAGYKGEIAKDLTYDVGALVYYYPSQHLGNAAGFKNADTAEIYGALTYNIFTVKYSHAVTTLFGFVDSRNSGYVEAVANFDVGNGFTVAPHVGYQKVAGNSSFSYTDYSVTGAKDFGGGWAVSLAAIGTSTKTVAADPNGYAYFSPEGKNLGKTAVVLGVKKTF